MSIKCTERLSVAGVVPSVGHVGGGYGKAPAELPMAFTKPQLSICEGPWRSFAAIELVMLEYVDWFNNRRSLSAVGNIAIAEAKASYYACMEKPKTTA